MKNIYLCIVFGILYYKKGNDGRNSTEFSRQNNILETNIFTRYLACAQEQYEIEEKILHLALFKKEF